SFSSGGALNQTFQVQTSAGCAWTAISNDAWITVTGGASGTGTGTVTYSVESTGGPARSGTITAGGQTFTVSQSDGCATNTLLNPSEASIPAKGATGESFRVLTSATCPWSATSDAAWITITSGTSG